MLQVLTCPRFYRQRTLIRIDEFSVPVVMFRVILFLCAPLAVLSCATGDAFCQSIAGPSSYCKFYQHATGNCQISNTPCTCSACPAGDSFCISKYGIGSYCKSELDVPVCLGSNTPCTCAYTPVVSTPTPPGPFEGTCDAACQKYNGPQSYCKSWLSSPKCFGGEQPCVAGVDCSK